METLNYEFNEQSVSISDTNSAMTYFYASEGITSAEDDHYARCRDQN